jgi:sulfoxide reductase catalytic subunit YedY
MLAAITSEGGIGMVEIKGSEITPEHIYLSRRRFLKGMGFLASGAAIVAACGPREATVPVSGSGPTVGPAATAMPQPSSSPALPAASATMDELGAALTPFQTVTNFNNYYEFTTSKDKVALLAQDFRTSPWTVDVGGLVNNPKTYDIDGLLKFQPEERIYRLRCVETWSMVIPWLGFPLSKLLAEVEPMPSARYVRFETLYDPAQMPGQSSGAFQWPYVEGLRLDEAMNDLALLATGLYGKTLLPQSGAPVRLVVPWKYGFKSIKSIVKIDLVEEMPVSLWMAAAPNEYGFYANVNPNVDHPRWSQATEGRMGETGRRKTLMFNGYADEVAALYEGMDLSKWF